LQPSEKREEEYSKINQKATSGNFTWLKSRHINICEVPELNRFEIQRPYPNEYFERDRITKMPATLIFRRQTRLAIG